MQTYKKIKVKEYNVWIPSWREKIPHECGKNKRN